MSNACRVAASLCLAVTLAQAAEKEILLGGWQLQEIGKVSADGAALSRVDYRPVDWYKAVVPGTVLTTLVANRVYPEPLYGENNRTIPESLCRTSYWYRTTISVPATHRGRHTWLRFDGINYEAHIWVNGREVGGVKGAFARGLFDITRDVAPGKPAAVAVRIDPPLHPSVPNEQSVANGTGPNGGAMGADGPTFVATVGWDWMPGIRDRDMGLWQGVSLYATGPVVLDEPYVRTDLPRSSAATLDVSATVRNVTANPQQGVLVGSVDGTGLTFRTPVSLKAGESLVVHGPALRLEKPKLWWPNGYGKQDRYRLRLRFEASGQVSDEESTLFGVRSISYFPNRTPNLTVTINGVPIMCKGGNWGMDEAMKRSPRARLEAQIRLHRDANCTMIRNWVGQATQEDFYDLCDKYGILVWDDFWLANPVDGPNPLDTDLFLANAREKIVRYRNHPSIALWCGRNEGDPPRVIDEGLARLVAELDGTRHYQQHSANRNGVSGYGPYGLRGLNTYFNFNDAFHTEIGAPSIPTLEAVKAMMPKKDWWPINDDWAYHDLARGAQNGDRYPEVLAARFGPIAGLSDFVRKAQLTNYESYRAIFEGRNSKLFSPASGVLLWMSNPAQPSFVWQLYSYDLESNAALFGTRKACEPIHIQMDPRDGKVQVINNTPLPLSDVRAWIRVYNLQGQVRSLQSLRLTASPSAATDVATIAFPAEDLSDVHFVRLELRDSKERLLSENFYWRSRPGPSNNYLPNDFTPLTSLPTAKLEATTAPLSAARGTTRFVVKLRNRSDAVALMAHIQLRRASSGARVLPVYYSDNYVSLLPGETRMITVEAAAADLKGERALIALDGWNAGVAKSSGPVPVVPNTAALPEPLPSTASPTAMTGPVFRILNAGGGAVGDAGILADETFAEGGSGNAQAGTIDAAPAGSRALPAELYRTERWGEFTYAIPAPAGEQFTVRLHFADLTYDKAGSRRFRVEINGQPVLKEFDIVAESGGKGRVLIKEFPGVVAKDGLVTIAFKKGTADWPEVRAVELVGGLRS